MGDLEPDHVPEVISNKCKQALWEHCLNQKDPVGVLHIGWFWDLKLRWEMAHLIDGFVRTHWELEQKRQVGGK